MATVDRCPVTYNGNRCEEKVVTPISGKVDEETGNLGVTTYLRYLLMQT